jgi:hypothetical protein
MRTTATCKTTFEPLLHNSLYRQADWTCRFFACESKTGIFLANKAHLDDLPAFGR